MRSVFLLVMMAAAALLLAPAHAGDLVAKYETPVLDGDGSDFTGDPLVASNGVTLKAAYDSTMLYVLAEWSDVTSTESIDKKLWTYSPEGWAQDGNEDRLAIIWNVSSGDFPTWGCAALCHMGARMRTSLPGETADEWHWKAARGNAMGYVDDKYIDDTIDPSDPEAGHHGDGGTSAYMDNKLDTIPAWMGESDPDMNASFLVQSSDISRFDPFGVIPHLWSSAVPFDTQAVFQVNSYVPGYVLRTPDGSRADVQAAGSYSAGVWTVEMSRTLVTTGTNDSTRDVQFSDLQAAYLFGVAVFDNSGGIDHVTDSGPHNLVFGSVGVEESNPVRRDVRVAPRLMPGHPNPFTSRASLTFHLPAEGAVDVSVYDLTGRQIKNLAAGQYSGGNHVVVWNGTNSAGQMVESGTYLAVLKTDGMQFSQSLVFLAGGK